MSGIRILPGSGFRTTEWSGGTTTELFIWPEDASYAERRFAVRISTALVELGESTFTPLPGVKRWITPLCPGFLLTVNGEEKELPYGEVLAFSGEDAVRCVGSGRDLNLMLKGAEGEMRIVRGAFTVPERGAAFIFSDAQQSIGFCDGERSACTSAFFPARSFAAIEPGSYFIEGSAALFLLDI